MRQKQRVFSLFLLSPSSRRAWIEMMMPLNLYETAPVALLAEGVDRNLYIPATTRTTIVALLAEGVDRNKHFIGTFNAHLVALLAEGVDRNLITM